MNFRQLTQEEIELVRPKFLTQGVEVPNPQISFFMGAFEGERLVGFQVCQLQLHLEPLWSEDPHCVSSLVEAMEREVVARFGEAPVFILASDRVAQLAEHFGYTRRTDTVLQKVVK